jgi:hypothetical protein
MKLTKSQLKQIIKEELNALNENTDPEKIFTKYPKVLEYVEALINTPKEFVQLLNMIIRRASVKDQQKVLALRAVLKQAGEGPGADDPAAAAGRPQPKGT